MKEASGPGTRNSASALQVTSVQKPAKGHCEWPHLCYEEASRGPQLYSCRQGRLADAKDRDRRGRGGAGGGAGGVGPDACAIKPAARTGTDLLRAAATLSFLFRAHPAPCTSRVPPWLRSPGTRSSRSCWSGTKRTLPTSSCANFLRRIQSASTTSGARTGSGHPGRPQPPGRAQAGAVICP